MASFPGIRLAGRADRGMTLGRRHTNCRKFVQEDVLKAISLAFLRVATGLLLVLWGVIKIGSPEAAVHVSDKYYLGLVSHEALQRPMR